MLIVNTIDSTYRIGYSTKYGYGFNQQRPATQNTAVYCPGQRASGNARRSPQRPDPDNDFWDWLRMNGIWGIGYDEEWPSYVDEDYWDYFVEHYPEYVDEAEQWFEEHGKTPPWMVPTGEENILFLICIFYVVMLYGKEKQCRRNSRKILERK